MQKKVIRYGQRSTTLDIRELLGLTGSHLLIDRVPQGAKACIICDSERHG